MTKYNITQVYLGIGMVGLSVMTSLMVFLDFDRPVAYSLLPLLPLAFAVCISAFFSFLSLIPKNLGASAIILLFFVRDVISPLFMCLGEYSATITENIDVNTSGAILLVVYETVVVFAVLFFKFLSCKNQEVFDSKVVIMPKTQKKYGMILLLIMGVLAVCIIVTPSLMLMYRSIKDISNDTFTHFENSYIVTQYGTTFIKKLSLVTGQFIMKNVTVFVPAFFIVVLSKNNTKKRKLISLILCFVPLLFVGGAIARSLIYILCLLLLHINLFSEKINYKLIIFVGIAAVVAVVAWWIYRSYLTGSFENPAIAFSTRISAYFSGVNVVSGVFNLPEDIGTKIKFFFYDFLGSVPYGGTLFGLSSERIQPFFNLWNASSGQIPTTIGMGYYYFGWLLSPIYSVVFALIAFKSGQKFNTDPNAFSKIRWLLMAVYFSMGIVMYNIEITLSTAFSMFVPIYIVERISARKGDIVSCDT